MKTDISWRKTDYIRYNLDAMTLKHLSSFKSRLFVVISVVIKYNLQDIDKY